MAKIEAKQVVVNEIKDKLEKAQGVVLVSARGLTVAQDTEMRRALREAGVDYKEAYEKNIGTYGRFADAVKYIDPRQE